MWLHFKISIIKQLTEKNSINKVNFIQICNLSVPLVGYIVWFKLDCEVLQN